MTDNFSKIRELLDFQEGEFYFIQVLLRKKEADCTGSNNKHRCLKAYYVDNMDYFNAKEEEIKNLCHLFNARAYIHLARRSYKDVAMECMENICKRIRYGQYQYINREYNSACGKLNGNPKLYLIDVDTKDEGVVMAVREYVDVFVEPLVSKHVATLPTKHGYHIITTPFNVSQFNKKYPDIMVQTNNPTILYENVKTI